MILYKSDWDNYPSAIPDYTTQNVSFVRYSKLLKAMGVENHLFCLALIDPTLQGIDPFDSNLSELDMEKIVVECIENPWYFFREVLKIPAVAGAGNSPLLANRGNISLFWLFFNHVTTMLIQPRQTGKSVSTDSLMVWLLMLRCNNTMFSLLTKDDNLRVRNVKRLKDLIEDLPFFLKFKNKTDANNTERLTNNSLGNVYSTNVAQASIKAALNLGRGMTNAINHIDEIAFITNIDSTLPGLLAASGKKVA